MYAQVASKWVIDTTLVYSQAVSMEGGNAANVDVVAYESVTGSDVLDVTLQVGADLENWMDTALVVRLSASNPEFNSDKLTAIAAPYVRLKAQVTTGSITRTIAAGINVANL